MMGKWKATVLVSAIAASLVIVGTTWAGEDTDQQIPEKKLARLLEKFGEEGIDANGDGALTHDEVQAFFAAKHPEGMRGKHGKRGKGKHSGAEGCGHHGKGQGHHGLGDRWLDEDGAIKPRKQERLMEKFGEQGIDADADGTLTAEEAHAFFAERRPQGMKGKCDGSGPHGKGGMHGMHGPGHGPGMHLHHLGMMLHDIDLTDEQQTQVEVILDKLHEDARALHQAAHDEISALLTEEQAAKLKEWHPGPEPELE